MTDPPPLDCHPASPAERVQAFKNVFDIWRNADSMEEHLAKRLASPQHKRAAWFVGCLRERVVVSLGCYPMRFSVHRQVMKGIAIGAVHTVSDCRGRGYAPELLAWVEQYQAQAGGEISMLFSDIPSEYYARLGYTLCRSLEGWIRLDQAPRRPRAEISLIPFSPKADRPSLMDAYAAHHQHLAFSIARDEAYWSYLFNKGAANDYYWAVDADSNRQGYVALSPRDSRCSIRDFGIAAEWEPQLITAILSHAQSAGFQELGGWLPQSPAFAETFELTPRGKEITMLKWLGDKQKIDPEIRQSASGIHEIDHV